MSKLFAGLAVVILVCAIVPAAAAPAAPGSVDSVQTRPVPRAEPPADASQSVTPVPAKTKAKKPKKKRRYARYGYSGYPYYRRAPFYYAHPRFWWPFHRPRYRYYRHHR